MMRNYTGVDHSPFWNQQREFPEEWLEAAYINGEDLAGTAIFDENNPQAFIDAFYFKYLNIYGSSGYSDAFEQYVLGPTASEETTALFTDLYGSDLVENANEDN